MDLLEQTIKLCQEYGIKPARSKGQNFLINEKVYDDIVAVADINKDDVILEVGPGLGFLTEKLAEKAGKVIAVELDDKISVYLKNKFKKKKIDNIEVVNEDVLKLITNYELRITNNTSPLASLLIRRGGASDNELGRCVFKIVANLPYNITSIFLRKIFELENKPDLMVLMLQKEVADRIVAKPGKMSVLAVSLQLYSQPKIIQYVSKKDFWPSPEIDSAIIEFTPHPLPPLLIRRGDEGVRCFFRLVKFGFSARRKMLKNNLSAGFRIEQKEIENILVEMGLNPMCRAQDLSVEDWVKLNSKIKSQNAK
jgi:16S rRNA (adenine1518-N6/adenine1519-N6)-dimethyltransferase